MMKEYIIDLSEPVLVTGASGFIGARVVDMLLEHGFREVRCMVRQSSNLQRLESVITQRSAHECVNILEGDLTSRTDCVSITKDVRVIYHLAAGTEKSFAGSFMNSALSTRNLVEAFLDVGEPARFVNVSSFAVYSNYSMKRGATLDETAPIENASQERYDPYGFGKIKQEQVVIDYAASRGLRYVMLRPGTVFGPGRKTLTGRIGIDTFGFFMHIGGANLLPLTFVDNCAEAIVLAGLIRGIDNEVFNVVDDDLLTSRQFLRAYKKAVGGMFSVRIPYFLAYGLSVIWEEYSKRSGGQLPPAFNRRRCIAEWRGSTFPNRRLHERLGWKPRVGMDEAMARFLSQFDREER